MSSHISISDDVMTVLRAATIEGNSLKLIGQLDRKLYERTNAVLEAAGGQWNRKAKAHLFQQDPKTVLGLAMESGEILNKKQAFQQFFTPTDLAKRIVKIAGIKSGMAVLEPSAGDGAIADQARAAGANVSCIEIQPELHAQLKAKGYTAWNDCFLAHTPDIHVGRYDAIVMNPPFTKDQDIQHVRHAFDLLKPGGILVSVMSPGFTFGTQKKRAAFRAFVEENGEFENLPDGTFKEAGTNVRTVLVTLRKPK